MTTRSFRTHATFAAGMLALLLAVPVGATDSPEVEPRLLTLRRVSSSGFGGAACAEYRIYRDGRVLGLRSGSFAETCTALEDELPFVLAESTSFCAGIGDGESLRELNQKLSMAQAGYVEGDCGHSYIDFYQEYEITWYGRFGRSNTIRFLEPDASCPEGVELMFYATLSFVSHATSQPGSVSCSN